MKEKKKLDIEKLLKGLIIITIAAIWGQSMIRREASQAESDALLMILNPFDDINIGDVSDNAYWILSDIFRKIAHIIEYGILGSELMVYRTIKSGSIVRGKAFVNLLVTGLLVGLVDETIQVFSHRGSMVTDVWIDTIGMFLGLMISRLCILMRSQHKQ